MENKLIEINKNKSFWLGPLTIWKNIREHHFKLV